jgi:hypothetical protein
VYHCPVERPAPTPPAVVIECLLAAANGNYSGPASTTVVGSYTLHHSGNLTWLQGPGWEGVVYASGPDAFTRAMLATVLPTGRSC